MKTERDLPPQLYRRDDSPFLWMKYSMNGMPFYESTKIRADAKNAEKEALKKLNRRLAQITTGMFHGLAPERMRVDELAKDLIRDYENNQRKSIKHVRFRWEKHLKPVFGHVRAAQVTTARINAYIDERRQEHAQNGTINRELALLKRAFKLGERQTPPKVGRVPAFPQRLKEDNVRKGFVEDAQYTRLADECGKVGLWMRALLECGYVFGWRRKSELLKLRVGQVDLLNRTIRLNGGETKNDKGRVAKMAKGGRVYLLLLACVADKKPDAFVFTRDDGTPVRDFRQTWQKVCIAAGVGRLVCRACGETLTGEKCCGKPAADAKYVGLIFHDLRRTAVRNMIRRGVPQSVAMLISGHKTADVFRRYDIVDERDLDAAADRMEREQGDTRHESNDESHATETAKEMARSRENGYDTVTSARDRSMASQ